MTELADRSEMNQQKAALAFSRQSAVFDRLFSTDGIVQYKRDRVRAVVKNLLPARSKILELNSGTGEDAIWFAKHGHEVNATDISSGMQQILREKLLTAGLQNQISTELCSFTALQGLNDKGPYDMIFSNFGGLNCTDRLDDALQQFGGLLRPGGTVVLVVISPVCLWELLLAFRGKFATATRRLRARNGVDCKVEGIEFRCWYHKPKNIKRKLQDDFLLLDVEGLCTIVPPSYMGQFRERHSRLFRWLARGEQSLKNTWPFKYIGDYYIISFRRK